MAIVYSYVSLPEGNNTLFLFNFIHVYSIPLCEIYLCLMRKILTMDGLHQV